MKATKGIATVVFVALVAAVVLAVFATRAETPESLEHAVLHAEGAP